jgi:hypothetical protein
VAQKIPAFFGTELLQKATYQASGLNFFRRRPIKRISPGIVRSAAFRKSAFSLLNAISIGFKSGE